MVCINILYFFSKSFSSLWLNGIQFYWGRKQDMLRIHPIENLYYYQTVYNFPATWEMAEK